MDESEQHGAGIKKEETNAENTELKKEDTRNGSILVERARRLEMQENPLFRANLLFMPYKRHALKGAVKREEFTVTFLSNYVNLAKKNL